MEAELVLATHALWRVAAWPVETADGFTSDGSASLGALVGECEGLALAEHRLAASGRALADRVHDAVPSVDVAPIRHWLLAVRRQLHGGTGPLAEPPVDATATVADELRHDLARAASDRQAHRDRADALRHRYDEVVADERRRLHELAATPRFRSALLLANEAVAAQWDRRRAAAGRTAPPKARVRRLEGTVLHHLLRACGRPTPNGLFAGIVPVEPVEAGEAVEVGRVAAVPTRAGRLAVAPDLGPYADALDRWRPALAGRPGARLRRNPTAHRHGDEWVRHAEGTVGWGRVPDDAALTAAMAAWPDVDAATADHLVAVGLVEPDIGLDVTAGDPWSVLEHTRRSLPDPWAACWRDAVDAARVACTELEAALGADDVDAARAALARVRAAAQRLGGPVRDPIARVDLRLGWRVGWSEQTRATVAMSVSDGLAGLGADGAAERYRRARLGRALAAGSPSELLAAAAHNETTAVPTAIQPTRSGALAAAGVPPAVTDWESLPAERFAASGGGPVIELPGGAGVPRVPAGCGPVGTVAMVPGATWWLRWCRPQPAMVATRFAPLLPPAMLEEHTALVRAHHGVQIVGAHHPNPSAAVRVAAPARIGRNGSTVGPDGVRVTVDGGTGVRVTAAAGRSAVPVYDSASAITPADPVGRFLGAVTMANGWELLNYGFPHLPAERGTGHLPQVTASRDGRLVTLSAERWTVGPETVAELAALDDLQQYRSWRAWCGARSVPALVLLRWEPTPGAPEYLFPTQSPLAVRSLFDHLPQDAGPLVATALPAGDAGWPIRDEHGRRHVAELVVTWWRDDA